MPILSQNGSSSRPQWEDFKLHVEAVSKLSLKPGDVLVVRMPESARDQECLEARDLFRTVLRGSGFDNQVIVHGPGMKLRVMSPPDLEDQEDRPIPLLEDRDGS